MGVQGEACLSEADVLKKLSHLGKSVKEEKVKVQVLKAWAFGREVAS